MNRMLARVALLAMPILATAQPLWVRYLPTSPNNDLDWPLAVVSDVDNNIYVTGCTYEGASGGEQTFTTVSYDSSGVQRWVSKISGQSPTDNYARAEAITRSHSMYYVYATGVARKETGTDFLTVKYDPEDGDTLWTGRYVGPYGGANVGKDVAVDDSENVIATGYAQSTLLTYDIVTIKYNSNGGGIWERTWGDTTTNEQAADVAVDEHGCVYVTGFTFAGGGGTNIVTIKYSPRGSALWTQIYSTSGTYYDHGLGVALDASKNVYVGGHTAGATDTSIVILKYDSTGTLLWDRIYDSPGQGDDRFAGIAASRFGGAYVVGTSDGFGNGDDVLLIRYTTDGDTAWVRNYDGAGHGYDQANGICYRRPLFGEEIYVAGSSGSGAETDYLALRYNMVGNLAAVETYNGVASGYDVARAVTLDNSANVIVTGQSESLTVNTDYCTMKYPEGMVGLKAEPHVLAGASALPTVVRGVLYLPGLGTRSELPGSSVMSRAALLDAAGRKVLDLRPGANDVSGLVPGVYFVREHCSSGQGCEGSSFGKVVVAR